MAQRRGLGAALAGIGGALEGFGTTQLRDIRAKEADRLISERQAKAGERTEDRAELKAYRDSVMRGDMDPAQAAQAAALQGIEVPPGYFDSIQPSVDSDVSKVVKGIADTKSYADLPTEAGLNASMPKRIAPLHIGETPLKFLDTSTEFPPFDQPDPNAQRVSQALHAKRKSLSTAGPVTETESVDPETGAPRRTSRRFNPMRETFDELGSQTTGPSAKQRGVLEGQSEIEKLLTDLQRGGPEARGAGENRKSLVEGPVKRSELDKELGVRDTHEQKQARFREGLTADRERKQLTMGTTHDADGNEIPIVIDKGNATSRPVELPPGMKGGKPVRLTQTQQTTQADLNEAETTGVKLLEQLRATGLDKVNDPGDPRWQKFLVNTLQIAPKDSAKAGIQWDTAFINATLSRTLMGGRPSQYIAELMQPHMPQQAMSGKQLTMVMERILDTIDGKRQELAGVSKAPLSQLSPKGGKSYNQYRIERQGIPATGPADYTVGPNGELVPARK